MIERTLVVNADDFGQSPGVTRGIIEAHQRGIVTSASLMVLWPASTTAASYARTRPELSVGLHIDLGEWTCLEGTWRCCYQRVDLNDTRAVEHEVRGQLERCRYLLGGNPTHLDSHQHVHRKEPILSVLTSIANELGVPLRHVTPGIRYCGDFYGQTAAGNAMPDSISVASLLWLLLSLPRGVTELGCHPGYAEDLDTVYKPERRVELRTLCAREVRATVAEEQIRLATFQDLAAVR